MSDDCTPGWPCGGRIKCPACVQNTPDADVVCGHREPRATGVWACVSPPDHTSGHYYVRLNGAG